MHKDLFLNSLNGLRKDVELYPDDASLWKMQGDIKNAPGTLCLHVCGNLKHNIGAVLGKSGYVRTRDLEFSKRDISKADILKEIDETIGVVGPVLENLKEENINLPFPDPAFGEGYTIASALTRLSWHLGYHMGQINYHRRILMQGNN